MAILRGLDYDEVKHGGDLAHASSPGYVIDDKAQIVEPYHEHVLSTSDGGSPWYLQDRLAGALNLTEPA